MPAAAIRISRTGGPEVMTLDPIEQATPGSNEVWVEHEAIGVNYLDVTQRNGSVPIPLPSGLGLEAAGRVTAIGPDVAGFTEGDRVAYILGPLGSYATGRLYPAERLVKLPAGLAADDAAAVLFKGITAQYLLKSTYPVGEGTVVVLYGVAGGLGRLMVPWAKHLGAIVIGVVSDTKSVETARALGCDQALVWGACDLSAEVSRFTGGAKANVVYDPIGKATFSASLDCLRPRGLMVSFGASSGAPDPVSVSVLNTKGSLFLTRPSLAAHAGGVAEYRHRAEDVLAAVTKGVIGSSVWKTYPLADVATAHAALEHGISSGAILLKP